MDTINNGTRADRQREERRQAKLREARSHLAEVRDAIDRLNRFSNARLIPLISIMERELNELVSSDEVYIQAAASLWVEPGNGRCVTGSVSTGKPWAGETDAESGRR